MLRGMELKPDKLFELAIGFEESRNKLRDLITEIRQNVQPPADQVTEMLPSFCRCLRCQQMPSREENKCCGQRMCRSESHVFKNICIDRENVSTAIRNMADTYVFTPVYENKAMRHASYRQYVMWQHGHLGSGKRIVIPSCCVWAIRRAYPSPDGLYTGFKPGRRCLTLT